MINFEQPWNILWLLPMILFWFNFGKKRDAYFLLLAFIFVDLILMKPVWVTNSSAPMLVVVLDRSLSIKPEQVESSKRTVRKVLSLTSSNKIAIVTFGRNVAVEKWFDEEFDGELYLQLIDPESSSLNDALLIATSLIPQNKSGKILLLTDGEYRGVNPLIAAGEAQRRNIKIDMMRLNIDVEDDVGVSDILLPIRVASNESFQLSVDLFATKETEVSYELRRLGVIVAKGKVVVPVNGKTLSFVDIVNKTGSHTYEFQIKSDTDVITNNNIAKGVLQVDGKEKIIVINTTGKKDNFCKALEGAGKEVQVFASKTVDLSIGMLEEYQLIVFENVPADHFSEKELKAVQISVEFYGKSFLMTGGRASFGIGGYLNSVIEPILPVDMVAKNEKRQIQLGICLMLDRSGSMGAGVGLNRTKMDLADMGSEATLRLLSPRDEICVIAVDTEPHYVVPMSKVDDNTEEFAKKILSIESTGGGIYTYTALVAGVKEIDKSSAGTRHMILFADAADAEEYGDSIKLCKELASTGVTTSVVALGKETDSDGEFLKDVAKAGQGRIFFTEEAESLPRLFTQDVIQVKRNSFDEAVTSMTPGSGLTSLGNFPFTELPKVGGVNLNYIKTDTQILYMCENEYNTPGIVSWMSGAGKVMAISFEVDGKYTGNFTNWEKYDNFFAGLGRYMIPRAKNSQATLIAERNGHQVLVQLQTDPADPISEDIKVEVFSGNTLADHKTIPLRLIEEGIYQGQYNIQDSSPHFHMCKYKKEVVKGNAVILPYSPEYEKSFSAQARSNILDRIIDQTKGKKHLLAGSEILEDSIPVVQKIDILLPLLFFCVLFLMIDILQKRIEFRLPTWRKKEVIVEEKIDSNKDKPVEVKKEEDTEGAFSYVKKSQKK